MNAEDLIIYLHFLYFQEGTVIRAFFFAFVKTCINFTILQRPHCPTCFTVLYSWRRYM